LARYSPPRNTARGVPCGWNYRPAAGNAAYWNELEIRLLRREAEVVILLAPIYRAVPFAH
jgi:hypothetical protein